MQDEQRSNPRHRRDISVDEIYGIFLNKINYIPNTYLYRKPPTTKFLEGSPQKSLEGKPLHIAFNLCLLVFVAWKDNILHKDEIRLSKLAFTLLKRDFPKENKYNETAMNEHLSLFLDFLASDFEFKYLPEILHFLYEQPSVIDKSEMKLQMEIVSKIDGHRDPREKDLMQSIIACFYDKLITVDEFLEILKEGIDFDSLKLSAKRFPEFKYFISLN